jgi:hypothetical protein
MDAGDAHSGGKIRLPPPCWPGSKSMPAIISGPPIEISVAEIDSRDGRMDLAPLLRPGDRTGARTVGGLDAGRVSA